MARILLAASSVSISLLSAALHGHELLQATKSQQAARLLIEDGIELFVIGVHFDDSRAMELVKLIQTDKKHANTPILIVRITASEIADFIRQTMNTMKALNLINDYLEVELDPLAELKIRDAVAKYLRAAEVEQNEQKTSNKRESH